MATKALTARLSRRQRTLVSLFRGLGTPITRQDFQKVLFLYCRDCQGRGVDPPYDFVPHRQGFRSFTSDADTGKLLGRGILDTDGDAFLLTPDGIRLATHEKDRHVSAFARRFRGLGTDHRETLDQIPTQRPVQRTVTLATIGYEGRSYEGFFNGLLRAGVSLLCDVRRNPLSRKWGFSKRRLSEGCERLGLDYRHLPELGITSDRRRNLATQDAYDRLFEAYEHETLNRERESLSRIREWIEAGHRVALMCYERLPRQCHRSRVATAVAELPGRLILPKHL